MSDPTPDELRRETEEAEIEIPLLERHLKHLQPRDRPTPWDDFDVSRYVEDEFYRHEITTSRRDYLLGRFNEMREREGWRMALAERRKAGISRFLPGNYSLERLTRPEWERQMAVMHVAGSTGLSVSGAQEHQAIMRQIRGEPPTQ
jgi:hypothetical protein